MTGDSDVEGEEPPIPAGLDELVHASELLGVGPQTVALLTSTLFEHLTPEGQTRALRHLTEYSAYLEALKAELIAVIAGPAPATLDERRDDFAPHEISVATKTTWYAADRHVSLARDLEHRLCATLAAMHAGSIRYAQALVLSEATDHLDVAVAREIEAKILMFSHRQCLSRFRAALRRWLAKLDPDFTQRATPARKECVVEHTARDDGTGELYIRGPLELTTEISMALTAYAAKIKAELGGTVAQRKVAALRDLAERYLGSPGVGTHHGRLPTVNVVIDLLTWLGLNNIPAEIPGLGAVPADAARWLVVDGAPLRRLITDPMSGQLLDYGHTTYTVPAKLADYLIAKNPTSASPNSTIDSRLADMEHNPPYDDGGNTNPIDVTPVCRRWHWAKTHGDWKYVKDPSTGTVIWTGPTGLTCQIDPYDYRP